MWAPNREQFTEKEEATKDNQIVMKKSEHYQLKKQTLYAYLARHIACSPLDGFSPLKKYNYSKSNWSLHWVGLSRVSCVIHFVLNKFCWTVSFIAY